MLLGIWSAVGRSNSSRKCSGVVEMYIQLRARGGYMGQQLLYQLHPWKANLHVELPFFQGILGHMRLWVLFVTQNLISGPSHFLERSLILQGFWKIFRGHVEFQGSLPWLHFFLMNNPKKKSNQGFDFNLPHGIDQLWHRMMKLTSSLCMT